MRFVVAALVLAWLGGDVLAAPTRYALVIGQNRGDPDEEVLRYAERDARRVGEVLMTLGDVDRSRLAIVLAPDRDALLVDVDTLVARIAKDGGAAMLVVYYSGHADGRALHLAGTRVWLHELQDRVRAAKADIKVMIIDACRSGAATRVKGGKPAPPFTINAADQVSGEGIAVITSAAADEDAQESDQLEGSFFTHHLVTGLMGAADRSADQQISLAEAYEYAYEETLRATSTAPKTQHPTYSFQLSGRQEVILTRLTSASTKSGLVSIHHDGEYLVFEGSTRGVLVAELRLDRKAQLALPPGRYVIRRRADRGVFDAAIAVTAGRTVPLDVDKMHEVPRGAVIRKGLGGRNTAWSIGAGALTRVVPLDMTSSMRAFGPMVTAALATRAVTLELRVGTPMAKEDQGWAVVSTRSVSGDVGALRSFDYGRSAWGVGLRIGIDRAYSKYDHPMESDWTGVKTCPVFGAFNRLSWSTGRASVFADVGANLHVCNAEDSGWQWNYLMRATAHFAAEASFGLQLYF